jgi:hypothetical protein
MDYHRYALQLRFVRVWLFFVYFPNVVISLDADKIDAAAMTTQLNMAALRSSHIVIILLGATVTLALPRG